MHIDVVGMWVCSTCVRVYVRIIVSSFKFIDDKYRCDAMSQMAALMEIVNTSSSIENIA